jgi:hypothetical protein
MTALGDSSIQIHMRLLNHMRNKALLSALVPSYTSESARISDNKHGKENGTKIRVVSIRYTSITKLSGSHHGRK